MDARERMKNILAKWGHDVYLQRRTEDTDDVDPLFPTAIFSNELERHTVRCTYPHKANLAFAGQEVDEGLLRNVDMVYYFWWNAAPREGDRIYEYPQGADGLPVDKQYSSVWVIDIAIPMRGENGRVEYWTAGATRSDPN